MNGINIELAIGDRIYSSWSLRGWLLCAAFGLKPRIRYARLRTEAFDRLMEEFAPTRTVPAMRLEGQVIWDSLAMAETLAERYPRAGHWPADPGLRGLSRSLAAEMHSGFAALRRDCPMNLWTAYSGFAPTGEVQNDVARIDALWNHARASSGSGSDWLLGSYSVADAFFAPVAARIAGYGLGISDASRAYVAAHLAEPNFRRWRAMGQAGDGRQPHYHADLPELTWPGPAPLPARAVEGSTPLNSFCPYSGQPVRPDSMAEIDGRVIGFCNPICRDQTVADPEAWPETMALLG